MRIGPGLLYLIVGPSGAGKTSIFDYFKSGNYPGFDFAVSTYTTRPEREDDHMSNYIHIDRKTFQDMIDQDQFVEYANVHDHLYGTVKSGLQNSLMNGLDIMKVIDYQGAKQVKAIFGDKAKIVYVAPPTFEVLKERLESRGIKSEEDFKLRLENASAELAFAGKSDYLVINDELNDAITDVEDIIRANRLTMPRAYQNQPEETFEMFKNAILKVNK